MWQVKWLLKLVDKLFMVLALITYSIQNVYLCLVATFQSLY